MPAALPWRSPCPVTTATMPHALRHWYRRCFQGASVRYSPTIDFQCTTAANSRVRLPPALVHKDGAIAISGRAAPKMNAFNERFNRTVQTDFVDYEKDCLLNDLRLFNEHLPGFLDRYNGQRPHQGLNYQTPCQRLAQHLPHLSHMWWHHTGGGLDTQIHVRLLSQWWYSDGAAGASLPFSPVSKRHQHFNLFLATTKREQQ